jgi:hypothetical protein
VCGGGGGDSGGGGGGGVAIRNLISFTLMHRPTNVRRRVAWAFDPHRSLGGRERTCHGVLTFRRDDVVRLGVGDE